MNAKQSVSSLTMTCDMMIVETQQHLRLIHCRASYEAFRVHARHMLQAE